MYREQYYPRRMKFGMYMSANAVTWPGNNNGKTTASLIKSQEPEQPPGSQEKQFFYLPHSQGEMIK